jgi:hypothetical protein
MIRILVLLAVIASPFLSYLGTDEGCGWDPSGQCRPALQIDAGCGWDPNGQCQPAPQIEEGCIWDPNGHCRS